MYHINGKITQQKFKKLANEIMYTTGCPTVSVTTLIAYFSAKLE